MLPIVATLASMILMAVFATRHFASARAGVIAAVLFAAMPVVWLAVGGGATQIVLVPFSMASLLAFDLFHRGGNWKWLMVAGAAMAQMLYWHLAGLVLAPVYLAVGSLILLPGRNRIPTVAALIAGFALVSLPWAIGLLRDPRWLIESINAFGLYDANRFNLLQGLREMTSWTGLTVRSEMYWDSFNPALLFLGSGGLGQSLIGSSVFLLPFAVPLVRGVAAYLLYPRDAMDWLVLGMFAAAPAGAALIAQPSAPRLILLAPVAAIIATRGCYPGAFRITAAASPAAPVTAVTRP